MRNGLCLALSLVLTPCVALAQGRLADPATTHVRARSVMAAHLIDEATNRSAIVRALVQRLDASDIVAYVSIDMLAPPGQRGRLTIIGHAGGRRYVDIKVTRINDRRAELASLAHELQHAAEVAAAPEAVDQPSLDRLYRRIGFNVSDKRRYESHAALKVGEAVFRELADGAAAAVDGR